MKTALAAALIAASFATTMAAPFAPQENTKLPPERLAVLAAMDLD